jgi:hypothetical protein
MYHLLGRRSIVLLRRSTVMSSTLDCMASKLDADSLAAMSQFLILGNSPKYVILAGVNNGLGQS